MMQALLIVALIFIGIASFLGTPAGKGIIGETIVKIVVGRTKPGVQYVVNNLMMIGENGRSSQIDHIVINCNGVFVIETKNYSGRIYGDDHRMEWTQVLQYGRVKNHFYSPVRQNGTHVHNVRNLIGNEVPIRSLIVFVKGNIQYIESTKVYRCSDIKKVLAQPLNAQLDISKMEEIYNQLLETKKTKIVTNTEHIQEINQMLQDIDANICPRCHGRLVVREGKNGKFYGCENFPKCKFTKKF